MADRPLPPPDPAPTAPETVGHGHEATPSPDEEASYFLIAGLLVILAALVLVYLHPVVRPEALN